MEPRTFERTWIQGQTPKIDDLSAFAFQGEASADTFIIDGKTASGSAVDITGTIIGVYLGENNNMVPLAGTVSNGKAVITLDDPCYKIPGKFALSIYAVNGTQTICIYNGIGYMFRTQSARVAYPSKAIPDVQELYEEVRGTIADIDAAIDEAEAVIESIPEDYSELSADVVGLKTAVESLVELTTAIDFTTGYYIKSGGNDVTPGTTIDTTPVAESNFKYAIINCAAGDIFDLNMTGGASARAYAFIDSSDNLIQNVATGAFVGRVTAPANTAKLILNAKLTDGGTTLTGTAYQVYGEDKVEALEDTVEYIEPIAEKTDNQILSELVKTANLETQKDSTNYINLYVGQYFKKDSKYKIVIDLTEANFSSGWIATTEGASTTATVIDGGNGVSGWSVGDAVNNVLTVNFTASADASTLRMRFVYGDSNLNKVKVNVYNKGMTPIDSLKSSFDDDTVAKLKTVYDHNSAGNYFNLAFLTDTHSDQGDSFGAYAILNQIDKANIANMFVHGGDFLGLTSYNGLEKYVGAVMKTRSDQYITDKLCMVKGNHDNATQFGINNSQFALMFQNNIDGKVVNANEPDGGYFYKDFPSYKMRVICLNAWHDTTTGTGDPSLGTVQENWLYNTALKLVPAGYFVIVTAHSLINNSNYSDQHIFDNAQNILHAFTDKGHAYGGYEYSASDNGTLVAVITGHRHIDTYANGDGYNRITVASAAPLAEGTTGYAVDVFTVDTDAQILYETRFGGRASSRAFNFGTNGNSEITE